MRALAIDFGEARIGLAICDDEARVATPFGALTRDTDRRAIARLRDLIRQEEVAILVVGEPKGLDGVPDERTDRVHRFADKLRRATGLEIVWVDEALTTVEAAEALAALDMEPKRRRSDHDGRRDSLAALIILREAIDRGLVG
ncbi:MAG: Holliday junction resolvase RuvX [Thermoanaerobaculia bacterium]|nr:Holliday junction resolvase RuvX [Thermoanaerobaculia bacterium]